jgi:hypothetical protein
VNRFIKEATMTIIESSSIFLSLSSKLLLDPKLMAILACNHIIHPHSSDRPTIEEQITDQSGQIGNSQTVL